MPEDFSNGYEAIADEFMAVRSNSGQALVKKWAASLPLGATVVDIGAGSGKPMTTVLVEAGLSVSAIDASPKIVAAFKQNFPAVEVACEAAEHSQFFNRTFDAALAVGLIFLLSEDSQIELISRIANALNPRGWLLFTAPRQPCQWEDILTKQCSLSLGADRYRQILLKASLKLIDEHVDEGGAVYYAAQKIEV